jgi:hypothetical protein
MQTNKAGSLKGGPVFLFPKYSIGFNNLAGHGSTFQAAKFKVRKKNHTNKKDRSEAAEAIDRCHTLIACA